MEEETIGCDEVFAVGEVLDDAFFEYETKPKFTSLASSITKAKCLRRRSENQMLVDTSTSDDLSTNVIGCSNHGDRSR
ncbi:hypothetical protein MKW98_032306 [Papaver atlanticum]|uniref:Uncharacterized protein n=1 Tax=Papaver atlanticum TaxID=357466 RepID=A0AAD4SEG5_9MAGN|nr:hypothetical protein MKW98_032306 [Papaver atlanticum]